MTIAGPPFTQADGDAAARAILAFIEASVRAIDIEAVRPLIADDGVFYGSFEPVMRGFAEIRDRQFAKVWPNVRDFTIPLESIETGTSGDLAWAHNLFRTSASGPDGTAFLREGRMSWVFARRDGRWIIVHSHDSLFPVRQLRAGG